MQSKFKGLIDSGLLEKVNETYRDNLHHKRSNSYDHGLKMGKKLPNINLRAPVSRKLEDLFPNCH